MHCSQGLMLSSGGGSLLSSVVLYNLTWISRSELRLGPNFLKRRNIDPVDMEAMFRLRSVVDASASGDGLREFARDWKEILEKRQREDAESSEDEQ